jgi:hypothetical protein
MDRFRQLFTILVLGSTMVLAPIRAQSLTAIRDTISNADGSPFNGRVILSWQGFTAASGATVAPHSTAVTVANGYFSLFLVPTINASQGAGYTAQYESNDGTVLWTEYWQVAASWTPLTINQVRVSSLPGQGNSGGGSPGGGGSIGLPIQESDVTSLVHDLAARPTTAAGYTASHAALIDSTGSISSVSGNSSDCVHVDGSSGACGVSSATSVAAAFVDGETPSGIVNGANPTFSLNQAPSPAISLSLYRNGIMLRQGLDFTLSGSSVAFVTGAVPQADDVLLAFYRVAGAATAVNFADAEIPVGTINGVNTIFTLASIPNPALSLQLFKNGTLLKRGTDYTLSAAMVTFVPVSLPKTGDVIQAFYRY